MNTEPVAPVVAVASNGVLIVICPFCRRRHRHQVQVSDSDIGTRMSHCKNGRRDVYRIGDLPNQSHLDAVAAARKAMGWLHRHPWPDQFTPAEVTAIATLAGALASVVDGAITRLRQP